MAKRKYCPAAKCKTKIDENLQHAGIVLLLDTPAAPHSHWIKHEVDTANALLVPILPLFFATKDDPKKGPRFRSLLDLRRWVVLPFLQHQRRQTPAVLLARLSASVKGIGESCAVMTIVSSGELWSSYPAQRKLLLQGSLEPDLKTLNTLTDLTLLRYPSLVAHCHLHVVSTPG